MRILLSVAITLFVCGYVAAQGCSDAGFCTMGAMKPDQPFNKKIEFRLRSMELSFYRATTTLSPVVIVATADLNFGINRKTFFQVKLPYQTVSGTLGSTSGPGDISLCVTRTLISNERFDINLSIGSKIPTNNSNKKAEGLSLPMYYQTSLGTYDFITGLSMITRNWLFATGIQHPFNKNRNEFLWKPWEEQTDHSGTYIQKYGRSNQLKRGTDIMLRAERNFRFSRLNFSLGLLSIFRINKDVFEDATGKEIKHIGTTGLALSGIFTTGYQFNVKSGVRLLVGHKIIQRDHNLDGLTRNLVTTLSYCYRF
jgi:hypothetical protein